ncbi:MAG: hypothetical protein ABJA67_03745 [Chthonomonadales bacterium]
MAIKSLSVKNTNSGRTENRVTIGMLRMYVGALVAIAVRVLSNVQSAIGTTAEIPSRSPVGAAWQALGQKLSGGTASGSMGIQINSQLIGQLRTELFVFAILATGLVSLYIRYRRQKPVHTVSVSGFYAE